MGVRMNGFMPALILILTLSSSCFHRVSCGPMTDILEASADFLEKAFSQELDFDSPDVFSEEWIDKAEQIMKKYVRKIKEVHDMDEHVVQKRGTDEQLTITRDYQGVNALTTIEYLYDTTAQYPRDITLFYLSNDKGVRELCAATLQLVKEDPELEKANMMIVFKFEGDKFKLLDQAPVMGGVDIESFHIKGIPYIVCAEYDAGSSGRPLEGSVVYRLVDKKLQNVQTLNTKYPSDIAIWEDLNEIYMAVAISQVNQSTHISYEADSIVFRWLGEHFDSITTIKTYNARCVTPFKIGSTMYLAVANHMNNQDETDIDSEIFKYNLNEDRFVSHQKIRTHGAMDIKFFSSANKRKREHFIVVANSFEIGLDGSRIYETGSIVYKYADDYFVPFQSILLNAATQWLPISGPRGELVLIATYIYGIKAFQYDGWRFVETGVQYSAESLGPGISSMRSFIFGGGSVLAVANKNKQPGDADIFNLKFKPKYDLKEFHSDLHNWCESMMDKVHADDLDDLLQRIKSSPKEDDETIYMNGDLLIEDARIQKLETSTMKIGDSILMNEDLIIELNNYTNNMKYLSNELETIRTSIENSMKSSGENHFQGSLKFENLSMTCLNCKFENAYVSKLNGENVDNFLHNIVYLTDGLVSNESMTFEKVTVESFQAGPQYFNGKPITTLVGRSKDTHIPGILQLEGAATLFDGISVYGNVDGLPFSSRTLLLNDQDQLLDGSISVRSASVNNLDAASLNYVNASKFFYDTVKVKGYHDIYKPTVLKNVQVFDMKIDGHLDGVDLESIVNSTLKVCGDQTLSGQWRFEKLTCENFKLGLISGYDLENDFVKIHGSEYNIDGELEFNAPLIVKHLYVVDDFNGIPVSKGKLDVLLLQSDETVTVTGKKEFDLLNIKSDLTVLESFNELRTEEWNYVKTVSGPVELNEDAVIHGKISINGDLKTGDFRDNSGKFSLKKVLEHGIKLTTPVVAVKSLTISGIIEAENVQAETINGIRTESWVKKNEQVTITALKIFDGGIQVLKPLEVTGLINGVDLISLDKDVLKTYGDQTIDGLKIFKYMDAQSLTTGECLFGYQWCNDLLFTNEDQILNGSNLITGSVNVLHDFSVYNLTVEGYVAGYDLNFLIKDTLFDNDKNPVVKAKKTFRGPLSFDNLEVSGNIGITNIRNLLDLHYVKQYISDGSIIINQPTTINNIQLTGWLNDIPHEDFGSAWLLHNGEQTIKGDQVFKSVITKQNVVLLSGKVNEWNLQDKVKNAAMANENSYLGSVKLGKAITESLKLEGLIQGLNFSTDIVFRDDKEIKISAKKVFKTKLVIGGEMVGNGIEDQFNFEKICQLFMSDTPSAMKLAVEGNAEMDEEPIVEYLNELKLPDIFSSVWMVDRDTILYGHKAFHTMIFNDEVEVKGLVDGVDVKSLPQRYLSKTKDQVINGVASFPGGMIFEKTLTAQKALVEGKVSGIDPEYFISGVLLSGPDQTFTGVPKFEEILTEGNLGVLTVNGMDLDQDVMLWDRDLNVIKGKLEVKNLFVDELMLEEGATVQGIDIPQWERLAVKLYGDEENSIQVIKGTKTMIDAEFRSNLWIEGKLDQLEFDRDHIMLISEEQIVTGKKSFVQNPTLPSKNSLIANKVEIIGHLNDVDISDFFSRLVHKNEDITFTAPKTFTSPMTAENVIIKGLYHGVDITGTGLNEVSDMYTKLQQKYDELYSSSEIFHESLKRRAIYVSHYEFVHDLEGGGLVLPVTLHGSKPLLAVISKGNETSALLHIHEWDTVSGLLTEGVIGIDFENLLYATSLQCSMTSFVYIEFSNDTLKSWQENFETRDISIEGHVLEYTLKDGFSKSNTIETKGTTSAVPVSVPLQKNCCFFLAQWYGQYSFIVCQRGSLDQMVVFQKIQANKIYEASSGFIANSPYVTYVMDADEFPEKVGSKLHVWVYDDETKHFVKLQEILVEGARSLASTEYHGISYLAVTSGSVPHAVQPGMIKIYRFDPDRMIFVHWVNLEVTSPWAVKFSVLSSDELVLYVTTKNPMKPFVVYLYKGVAGFKEMTYAAHAPTYSHITTFNAGDWNNLVVLSSNEETKFFKPAFKGI